MQPKLLYVGRADVRDAKEKVYEFHWEETLLFRGLSLAFRCQSAMSRGRQNFRNNLDLVRSSMVARCRTWSLLKYSNCNWIKPCLVRRFSGLQKRIKVSPKKFVASQVVR